MADQAQSVWQSGTVSSSTEVPGTAAWSPRSVPQTSSTHENGSQPEMAESSTSSAVATPQHPFYLLPAELMLDIVDLLPPEGFINFAFANYPFLHARGLAPALSEPRISYITRQTQLPTLFPLLKLPAEIMLYIMRHLKPIDIMRFTVANYQILERNGIAPPLTPETVGQLRAAITSISLPE